MAQHVHLCWIIWYLRDGRVLGRDTRPGEKEGESTEDIRGVGGVSQRRVGPIEAIIRQGYRVPRCPSESASEEGMVRFVLTAITPRLVRILLPTRSGCGSGAPG
jgi:hypothetical protein